MGRSCTDVVRVKVHSFYKSHTLKCDTTNSSEDTLSIYISISGKLVITFVILDEKIIKSFVTIELTVSLLR